MRVPNHNRILWREVVAETRKRYRKCRAVFWLAGVLLGLGLGNYVIEWPLAGILGGFAGLLLAWMLVTRPAAFRLFRERKGLCVHCGYDLCATLGRCPECGTICPKREITVG